MRTLLPLEWCIDRMIREMRSEMVVRTSVRHVVDVTDSQSEIIYRLGNTIIGLPIRGLGVRK